MNNNRYVKILFLIMLCFVGLVAIFCVPMPALADPDAIRNADGYIIFKPQVEIPGEQIIIEGTTRPIGIYIKNIYNYATGIVGILAVVVMMFGGIIWITAFGNVSKIGEAKAWIGAALTGLVLALTSFMIMQTINPALVGFKSSKIPSTLKDVTEDNISIVPDMCIADPGEQYAQFESDLNILIDESDDIPPSFTDFVFTDDFEEAVRFDAALEADGNNNIKNYSLSETQYLLYGYIPNIVAANTPADVAAISNSVVNNMNPPVIPASNDFLTELNLVYADFELILDAKFDEHAQAMVDAPDNDVAAMAWISFTEDADNAMDLETNNKILARAADLNDLDIILVDKVRLEIDNWASIWSPATSYDFETAKHIFMVAVEAELANTVNAQPLDFRPSARNLAEMHMAAVSESIARNKPFYRGAASPADFTSTYIIITVPEVTVEIATKKPDMISRYEAARDTVQEKINFELLGTYPAFRDAIIDPSADITTLRNLWNAPPAKPAIAAAVANAATTKVAEVQAGLADFTTEIKSKIQEVVDDNATEIVNASTEDEAADVTVKITLEIDDLFDEVEQFENEQNEQEVAQAEADMTTAEAILVMEDQEAVLAFQEARESADCSSNNGCESVGDACVIDQGSSYGIGICADSGSDLICQPTGVILDNYGCCNARDILCKDSLKYECTGSDEQWMPKHYCVNYQCVPY